MPTYDHPDDQPDEHSTVTRTTLRTEFQPSPQLSYISTVNSANPSSHDIEYDMQNIVVIEYDMDGIIALYDNGDSQYVLSIQSMMSEYE